MSETDRDMASWQLINDKDLIQYKSVPCWLTAGHPLRRRNCQLCGLVIGGQAMRVIIAVPMTECTCPDQELHSIAYLVCAKHADPDALPVIMAAMDGHTAYPGKLS